MTIRACTGRPKLPAAATSGALHELLDRMVRELPVSHLRVLPPGSSQVMAPGTMAPDSLVLRGGDEGVLVFSVGADSPAWRAGMRPGYRVLAIAGTTLPALDAASKPRLVQLAEATRLLAGPQASEVQEPRGGGESGS